MVNWRTDGRDEDWAFIEAVKVPLNPLHLARLVGIYGYRTFPHNFEVGHEPLGKKSNVRFRPEAATRCPKTSPPGF
jgi:hypothetical protein